MAKPLSTTVSTSLSLEAGRGEGQIFWEEDDRDAPFAQKYVRLYGGDNASRHNTSGTLTFSGREEQEFEGYVVFTGSNSVQLNHPNPRNLSFVREGSFLDMNGNATTATVTYEPSTNSLISTVEGYCVYKVTYDAPYRLYLFRFTSIGGGCPSLSDPYLILTDYSLPRYRAAVILAIDPAIGVATLQLDPPLCPTVSFTVNKLLPLLTLEVDPDDLVRLRSGTGLFNSGCTLRLYPDVSAIVTATAGVVTSLAGSFTRVVQETVVFNNQSVAKLKYHPSSSVAVEFVGNFTDGYGWDFNPTIHLPGDIITETEWSSASTYTVVGTRQLGADEIAATTFGRTKPVYGIVKVTYTTTFRKYSYNFEYNSGLRSFTPTNIVATYDGQATSLQLDVPGGGSV